MGTRQITVLADLGFGDSGKGATVDYLCRRDKVHTVVRHNGGPQAGHNVVTPEGIHHEFHQFGAGTFAGAKTFLSRYMLISPLYLIMESQELEAKGVKDPLKLLTLDMDARIVTPYHSAANKLREVLRGAQRHGSCGHGVGETMADDIQCPDGTIRVRDWSMPDRGLSKIQAVRSRKLAEFADHRDLLIDAGCGDLLADLDDEDLPQAIADLYESLWRKVGSIKGGGWEYFPGLVAAGERIVFEPAQGVLLDEWYGFHPHTTWSTTTFDNADMLLSETVATDIERLGLIRAYTTRHGAGPMPTEGALPRHLWSPEDDAHNTHNPWQGNFRVGPLDLVLTNYAIEACGPMDGLVVSCMDKIGMYLHCPSYMGTDRIPAFRGERNLALREYLGQTLAQMTPIVKSSGSAKMHLSTIENHCGLPVTLVGSGLTADHRIEREAALI